MLTPKTIVKSTFLGHGSSLSSLTEAAWAVVPCTGNTPSPGEHAYHDVVVKDWCSRLAEGAIELKVAMRVRNQGRADHDHVTLIVERFKPGIEDFRGHPLARISHELAVKTAAQGGEVLPHEDNPDDVDFIRGHIDDDDLVFRAKHDVDARREVLRRLGVA